MQEKTWIDCPSCGSKNSMHYRQGIEECFEPKGYPPLTIEGLDGQMCDVCGDGFWSRKSERAISRILCEHEAEHDAKKIVAAEIASVQEAARALGITVQGVHKMMREGRLRYVYAAGKRFPIRKELASAAKRLATTPAARAS